MEKAIIIDDEASAREILATLVEKYCPGIEIIAQCANVPAGVLQINKLHPSVVFLDIEMPEYNGFELLNFFRDVDFEIIFVTAYSDYAVRAFEVSAVDYLLKPVNIEQLKSAVEKALKKKSASNMQQRLDLLKDAYQDDNIKRIAIPVNDGLIFIEVADILLLQADGAYTNVMLRNGTSMLVSKTLRFFDELLSLRPIFFRPHRSYIININCIRKYQRGESLLVMDNSMNIPVARDNKQEFDERLKSLKLTI